MKAINYVYFNLKKKSSVKQNKRNFIKIIGDKFAMSIRLGKFKISNSFCEKFFKLYNYFQSLK